MVISMHRHPIEIAVRGIGEDARIARKALSWLLLILHQNRAYR